MRLKTINSYCTALPFFQTFFFKVNRGLGNYEEGTFIPLPGTCLTTPPPGNDPATPLPLKQNILKRPLPLLDIYEMDLD